LREVIELRSHRLRFRLRLKLLGHLHIFATSEGSLILKADHLEAALLFYSALTRLLSFEARLHLATARLLSCALLRLTRLTRELSGLTALAVFFGGLLIDGVVHIGERVHQRRAERAPLGRGGL
jgi:hypothetical protein